MQAGRLRNQTTLLLPPLCHSSTTHPPACPSPPASVWEMFYCEDPYDGLMDGQICLGVSGARPRGLGCRRPASAAAAECACAHETAGACSCADPPSPTLSTLPATPLPPTTHPPTTIRRHPAPRVPAGLPRAVPAPGGAVLAPGPRVSALPAVGGAQCCPCSRCLLVLRCPAASSSPHALRTSRSQHAPLLPPSPPRPHPTGRAPPLSRWTPSWCASSWTLGASPTGSAASRAWRPARRRGLAAPSRAPAPRPRAAPACRPRGPAAPCAAGACTQLISPTERRHVERCRALCST